MVSRTLVHTNTSDSTAPETSRAVNRLMQPLGQPRELDPWLIWSAAALLLLGLVMVFYYPLIALGGYTLSEVPYAVFLLALFTLVASVFFHAFWAAAPEQAFVQQLLFFKNMGVVGGLLVLVSSGPGAWSLDAKRAAP